MFWKSFLLPFSSDLLNSWNRRKIFRL